MCPTLESYYELISNSCGAVADARKSTVIDKAPEVMVLHVKRYSSDGRKLNQHVTAEERLLSADIVSTLSACVCTVCVAKPMHMGTNTYLVHACQLTEFGEI
jgi:hypothetical protein